MTKAVIKTDIIWLSEKYPQSFALQPQPLTHEKLKYILDHELIGWSVIATTTQDKPAQKQLELFKEFNFKSFNDALQYMTKVAKVCNKIPHHPRWENTYKSLKIYLSTWDSQHIITTKDIILACYMEQAFTNYSATLTTV